MRRILLQEDFGSFDVTGFAVDPMAGQIDSDIWTVTGVNADNDLARGLSDGAGETTGNILARCSDNGPVVIGFDLADNRPILLSEASAIDGINGTDADEIIDGGGGRLKVVVGGGTDRLIFMDTAGLRDDLSIFDFDKHNDVLDLGDANIFSARAIDGNLRLEFAKSRHDRALEDRGSRGGHHRERRGPSLHRQRRSDGPLPPVRHHVTHCQESIA